MKNHKMFTNCPYNGLRLFLVKILLFLRIIEYEMLEYHFDHFDCPVFSLLLLVAYLRLSILPLNRDSDGGTKLFILDSLNFLAGKNDFPEMTILYR